MELRQEWSFTVFSPGVRRWNSLDSAFLLKPGLTLLVTDNSFHFYGRNCLYGGAAGGNNAYASAPYTHRRGIFLILNYHNPGSGGESSGNTMGPCGWSLHHS